MMEARDLTNEIERQLVNVSNGRDLELCFLDMFNLGVLFGQENIIIRKEYETNRQTN